MTFSLSMPGTYKERAAHYLDHAKKFQLGELPTEQSHEKTQNLSHLAKTDLNEALKVMKEVDIEALEFLLSKTSELEGLRDSIQATLNAGRKVFLSGCGATGRLSLKLEFLWRSENPDRADQVVGFMAGGDVALIRSIESFEDHFEFGEKQLMDLGFQDGDLLLGITEGGETSFVIGATEAAAKVSSNTPYFIYCNPTELLCDKVERSRRVIENKKIKNVCLAFGPMSLSGSTRMQATTVQLMAVAAGFVSNVSVEEYIESFLSVLDGTDTSFLNEFIVKESEIYQEDGKLIYSTDDFGMTILTDTTERSPTFSLSPFENFDEEGVPSSLCYFHMMKTDSAYEAWEKLLLRPPRTLNWEQYLKIAGPEKINGYDFSDLVFERRTGRQVQSCIYRLSKEVVEWKFDGLKKVFEWGHLPLFYQHLLLKLILNTHSTLVMGRLERYEGNWMTWVKPSNGKLIDRAIRYIQGLARKENVELSYERVAEQIFQEIETVTLDQPIVLRALKSLLADS